MRSRMPGTVSLLAVSFVTMAATVVVCRNPVEWRKPPPVVIPAPKEAERIDFEAFMTSLKTYATPDVVWDIAEVISHSDLSRNRARVLSLARDERDSRLKAYLIFVCRALGATPNDLFGIIDLRDPVQVSATGLASALTPQSLGLGLSRTDIEHGEAGLVWRCLFWRPDLATGRTDLKPEPIRPRDGSIQILPESVIAAAVVRSAGTIDPVVLQSMIESRSATLEVLQPHLPESLRTH